MVSVFFACVSRLKFIKRWGQKRSIVSDDVAVHSFEVSVIAHALATIKNQKYGGNVDANKVAVMGLYHDVEESVLCADFIQPIKYFNKEVTAAFKTIEAHAERRLLNTLPTELQGVYREFVVHDDCDHELYKFVKAADVISAYLKCVYEVEAGNKEFVKAHAQLKQRVDLMQEPEVRFYVKNFVPAFSWTVDDLLEAPSDEYAAATG